MAIDENFIFENKIEEDFSQKNKENFTDASASERFFSAENMDILNDIEMDITVVIGQAKMKVTDLINLKKGAIIELAQGSNEPLQIYANDKPIAKGAIISNNGKYCVRIL